MWEAEAAPFSARLRHAYLTGPSRSLDIWPACSSARARVPGAAYVILIHDPHGLETTVRAGKAIARLACRSRGLCRRGDRRLPAAGLSIACSPARRRDWPGCSRR